MEGLRPELGFGVKSKEKKITKQCNRAEKVDLKPCSNSMAAHDVVMCPKVCFQ